MLENILSGEDYAKLIIDSVLDTDSNLPEEERMDPYMIVVWSQIIQKQSKDKWSDYISGKIESFLFSDEEIALSFRKAVEQITSETLSSLFEKKLVELSVDENGEILYSLTEEGKNEAKKISSNE